MTTLKSMKTKIMVSIGIFTLLLTAVARDFAGIGIEIVDRKNATEPLSIGTVVPGSPAEHAGIKSGEFLISIDGTNVVSKSLEEFVGMARGLAGTSLTLELADAAMSQTNKCIVKRVKMAVIKDKLEVIDH